MGALCFCLGSEASRLHKSERQRNWPNLQPLAEVEAKRSLRKKTISRAIRPSAQIHKHLRKTRKAQRRVCCSAVFGGSAQTICYPGGGWVGAAALASSQAVLGRPASLLLPPPHTPPLFFLCQKESPSLSTEWEKNEKNHLWSDLACNTPLTEKKRGSVPSCRPAGMSGARVSDPAAVVTAWKRPALCRVVSLFPIPTGHSAGMTQTHVQLQGLLRGPYPCVASGLTSSSLRASFYTQSSRSCLTPPFASSKHLRASGQGGVHLLTQGPSAPPPSPRPTLDLQGTERQKAWGAEGLSLTQLETTVLSPLARGPLLPPEPWDASVSVSFSPVWLRALIFTPPTSVSHSGPPYLPCPGLQNFLLTWELSPAFALRLCIRNSETK